MFSGQPLATETMKDSTVKIDRSWIDTFVDIANKKTPSSVKDTPTAGDNTHFLNFVELVMIFAFDSSAFLFFKK
jgi:hypothetical protein